MVCTRKGSGRWPTRCAPLGDVTVVAPIQEASAIGHALTLRRPLRIETIGPNVFAVDGTPTDCVNIAITHVLQRQARPDRVRDQQGLESRRRCDLLGDRVGCARRRAARDSEHRGLDAARAATSASSDRRPRPRRSSPQAVLERGLPKFTLLNINMPKGPNKGFRVTVQAKRNHVTVGERAHGSAAASRTTGLRKGRTSGSRTTARTIRPCATATSRSRRCSRT